MLLLVLAAASGCGPGVSRPCLADGEAGLWITITENGTLEVEQTVLLREPRPGFPPLDREWVQHGVQATELLSSSLDDLPGRPTAAAARHLEGRRRDLRHVTRYRPYSDVLRISPPDWPQDNNDHRTVAVAVGYVARRLRGGVTRATFQISLNIPATVVDWNRASYTTTPIYCNAERFPVSIVVSGPKGMTGSVDLRQNRGGPLQSKGSFGADRLFSHYETRVRLDERDPALFWLELPREAVFAAGTRSALQELGALLYPDRSYKSVGLHALLSLLLLVGLARLSPGRAPRLYLYLGVGLGNLALAAPLLLESLGMFHLQRFGWIEWSLIGFAALLDLCACVAMIAIGVDRCVIAFLHRVGLRRPMWPEPLQGQLVLASAAGRDGEGLAQLLAVHLGLRNADRLSASVASRQQLVGQLTGRDGLSAEDSELLARVQSERALQLRLPPLSRWLRGRSAGREAADARRGAEQAADLVLEEQVERAAYRSQRETAATERYARVLERDLLWLIATPAQAARTREQLRQLEPLCGLSLDPVRAVRPLIDALWTESRDSSAGHP